MPTSPAPARRFASCILAVVCLGFISSVCLAQAADESERLPRLQVVPLKGAYVDRPEMAGLDIGTLLSGPGPKQKSFFRMCNYLDRLAADPDLDYVLFDLSSPTLMIGAANQEELDRHLAKLRAAGKTTYAWLENAGPTHYGIAAACNQVFMADFGSIDFPSRAMSTMLYRDALDLLGIRASVARCGEFKGAVEPYTNSVMSKHLRQHYERMLKTINDALVARVAKGRGLSTESVREAQGHRMFTATAAKAKGLVDQLAPYGAMREIVQNAIGKPVDWRVKTKLPSRQLSFFELFAKIMGRVPERELDGPGIAVLHLSGQIIDGDSRAPGMMVSVPTVKEIQKLEEDGNVEAVVLRINSPGGSATASEAIRRELLRLAAKKPVVISMGGVAASGGYWITCIGEHIFAERGTITGSIGVFAMKLSFGPLLQRFGVHVENITLDDSAAAFAVDRTWSKEDIARIEEMIGGVYDRFLDLVSSSRTMQRDEVDAIGGGRVWSGTQAQGLGLVDELGGLDQALAYLRKKAELPADCEVVHRPRPQPAFDLSEMFSEDLDEVRSLVPSAGLALLRKSGVDVDRLLHLIGSSIGERNPGTQLYLMNPELIRIH